MIRQPARPKSRAQRYAEHLAGLVVIVGALVAAFSAAHVLTAALYRWLGLTPSVWLAQLVSSFLGLALLAATVSIVFRFVGRPQRVAAFMPIIAALQQIARGDFSARIDPSPSDQGIFTELVDSVNTVAVELDQMEQLRQEFISNVSHEIQSPLTSIRGFAQALHNPDLDPATRQHYLAIIEAESLRLSKLSESLLALSALDADQVPLTPAPYRLDKQLRRLILACEPQWTAKALDLDLDLAEVTLTADEDLLSQVWVNLLHNAIKFTPSAGRIRIVCRVHAGQAEVTVADTGPGIAPADLPHIFERFYKADRARSAALNGTPGGSGLGLAIAHTIVTLHHGTLTAHSQPPAGAEFTVRLPLSS